MIKTIGITGANGTVGKTLVPLLRELGYTVIVFQREKIATRSWEQEPCYAYWNYKQQEIDVLALQACHAFVHLAGAGVADKRWTSARKKEILESRKEGTAFLAKQLLHHAKQCHTFLSASAIGYYGANKISTSPFTEVAPAGADFLAMVCSVWEEASVILENTMKRVIFRIGIVLSKEGGALEKFTQSLPFHVKAVPGNGQQIVSWIHVEDLCRAMVLALQPTFLSGTYNAVSPQPVPLKTFMDAAARYFSRPMIPLPLPAPLLRLAMGELAGEVIKSQNVSSEKLLNNSFQFRYATLAAALDQLLAHKQKRTS